MYDHTFMILMEQVHQQESSYAWRRLYDLAFSEIRNEKVGKMEERYICTYSPSHLSNLLELMNGRHSALINLFHVVLKNSVCKEQRELNEAVIISEQGRLRKA